MIQLIMQISYIGKEVNVPNNNVYILKMDYLCIKRKQIGNRNISFVKVLQNIKLILQYKNKKFKKRKKIDAHIEIKWVTVFNSFKAVKRMSCSTISCGNTTHLQENPRTLTIYPLKRYGTNAQLVKSTFYVKENNLSSL